MPKFKEKNTIEKVFNDGRDMIPFVTTEGGIAYGIGEIEKNKVAQLTFEEEVNKRVEEELLKRGVTDPSLMGALILHSLLLKYTAPVMIQTIQCHRSQRIHEM